MFQEIKLVSWSSAFKKGVIMWLWSIVWVIIGLVIGLVVAIGITIQGNYRVTLDEAIMNPVTIGREHIVPVLIGSVIAIVIIALGLWTALIKVVTESAVEELKK